MEDIFSLRVGGQAGQGAKATGLVLSRIAVRSGKQVHTYTEFPSLIKGGHNLMQILVSKREVNSPIRRTDFWILFDQNSIDLHLSEFKKGSEILFDEGKNYNLSKINPEAILFPVPLAKFAKSVGGTELLSNTVALGATTALLGGSLEILKNILSEQFGDKGEKIIEMNEKAAELGFNFALENFKGKKKEILTKEDSEKRMVLNGTDAVAMGAIAAGLQFAAIYPMSPVSNVLAVLAANQEKYNFIYKQPEDEISAINMAIGASLAGARSMTATSGGGFCLMTEGYGLASMTETPLVIVLGMRPGPATGLATWSGQGDLRLALHGHQGSFPKIVLAAGDVKEAFELTMEAFNLADKYQLPVIVLIDKNICENDRSYPLFDTSGYEINRGKITLEKQENYERYKLVPDGVSPRTFPGVGNFFISNSYEHTSVGHDTEDIKTINEQMKKRMAKIGTCAASEKTDPELFGPEKADITIVSWGSNKGSILEAMKSLPNVNFLHLTWMNPFPSEKIKSILEKAKHIINIEANYEATLAGLIREKTGIEIKDFLLKYDGRPIFPEEIIERIKSIKL
jgi:2-oxoglutarate/2-oxoacid ferredoxin oxidoreductase subunit alpha